MFDFAPAAVDAIELTRPDAHFRFEIAGTHWTIREPVADDAEPAAVVPLISTIADGEVIRELGPADDIARYGLAAPAARIVLFAQQRVVADLELGAYTVDRAAVYARRPDGHVILVPTAIHRATSLQLEDFRSRRVAVFDLSAVSSCVLTSPRAGTMNWQRRDDAWFTVVAGDTVAGDSVAVPSVLRRIRGMRAIAFPDAEARGAEVAGVDIHRRDGSRLHVHFFDVNGRHFARVDGNPRVTEIADDPADLAGETLMSLRDRRLLHFDPARAHRITVTTAETTAVMIRAGDTWALPNPALGTLDPARSADFVRGLRGLRYQRPAPAAAAPDDPSFALVVADEDGTIIESLYAATGPDPATRTVWSRSRPGPWLLDAPRLDELMRLLRRARAHATASP
jgi:hypothetical protein